MRKIKADPPQKQNKKVVFLTNLDKDEEIKEALQLGDGYFIKSQITPGSLVDELKTYLATPATSPAVATPDPLAVGLDGNTAAS
jgi:DNA-binding NarL/FixJ family response regulator